jgi:hypothetical protein
MGHLFDAMGRSTPGGLPAFQNSKFSGFHFPQLLGLYNLASANKQSRQSTAE